MSRSYGFLFLWIVLFLGCLPANEINKTNEVRVGSRIFKQRAPESKEIIIHSLPVVIEKPGFYILTKDLVAPASGIGILSDDVTIDLNGCSITFGSEIVEEKAVFTYAGKKSGNIGHCGIVVENDPRRNKDFKFNWNHRFKNIVIKNGVILEGKSKGLSFSYGLNLRGTIGVELEDLLIKVETPDTFGVVLGEQGKMKFCTIQHNGRHVTNRHQMIASVWGGLKNEIHHCWIDGTPQTGIKSGDESSLHHNFIRLSSVVTNGYGVAGYSVKGLHVFNNRIINTNGRGIHLSEKSSNWLVHDNVVETRETANREYPRGLATHGIKLEKTMGSIVYNNAVITVTTPNSYSTSLNLATPPDSKSLVVNNVFVAIDKYNNNYTKRGSAFWAYEGHGDTTPIINNTFISDQWAVRISDLPGNNIVFTQCGFQKLRPADLVKCLKVSNYKALAKGNRFVDCEFNGIDTKSYWFPREDKSDPGWQRDADYALGHTLRINVIDSGKAIANAEIKAISKNGLRGNAHTDEKGDAVLILDRFKVNYSGETLKSTLINAEVYKISVNWKDKKRDFEIKIFDRAMKAQVDLGNRVAIDIMPVNHLIGADRFVMAKDHYWRRRVAQNLVAKPGDVPRAEPLVHVGPLSPFKPDSFK